MSKRRYEPVGVSAIKDYETGEVMRRRGVCERLEEVEKEVERLRAEGTNECRIWQRARIRELEAKVERLTGLLDEWTTSGWRVCIKDDVPDERPPCGDCYICQTRKVLLKRGEGVK